MRRGHEVLTDYLRHARALPLRDYVPFVEAHEYSRDLDARCCSRHLTRAEPDDDINYTVLSLLLLEAHGADLTTTDVARMWLTRLPLGMTFTAELSHRGDGIEGARFVAALGALISVAHSPESAVRAALTLIPGASGAASAIRLGMQLAGDADGGAAIRKTYMDMSPVHTLNNLALVVWSLLSHPDDFSAAIGDAVAAGLDTDCNGATVGGLWGLQGKPIPQQWSAPWQGRVGVSLAGLAELDLGELVDRTLRVAASLAI